MVLINVVLIFCSKTKAAYAKIHKIDGTATFGKEIKFLNINPGGIFSNHREIKGKYIVIMNRNFLHTYRLRADLCGCIV